MSGTKGGGEELRTWDIAETMKSIQSQHKVRLDLTMTPLLTGRGRLSITLSAVPMPDYASGTGSPRDTTQPPWVKATEYGDLGAAAYFSCLYRLLLEMDWELSRVRWDQLTLPE